MRLFLAALALSALLAAQTGSKPARSKPARSKEAGSPEAGHKLLVISVDGLDARFLTEPALRVKTPNLRRLMRDGASATVIGVAPSETWPANASLVTGVSPWQHGITENEQQAKLKFPALWDAAIAKGLKVATVCWPDTLGIKVSWDFPAWREPGPRNALEFDAIAQRSSPPGITALVERMFPSFEKQLWDDSASANAATYLLVNDKPDLTLVRMTEIDAEQHETTARSIYAREILENDDELIGQMLAKMPAGTIVAVVSDHGFENNNRVVRPRVMLRQAKINGTVEVADGLIGTPDAAVAAYLKTLMAQARKTGISRQVPMAEVRSRVPALGRWVAAFDTLPDYTASEEDRGPAVGPGTHLGVHGFWPTHPGYRSVFILSGEGVRAVKLGEIDMLQIAPSLADVLAVKLPSAKSNSLWKTISRQPAQ